jgi:hypothetical protein
LGVTVIKLEKVSVHGFSPTKPQREYMVWEAAKDPIGLSVNRLSVVTDLGVNEVKRIVQHLHSEGYLKRKSRGNFMGWVSIEGPRVRTRFSKTSPSP